MTWSIEENVRVVSGRGAEPTPTQALAESLSRYPRVLVDLGTGDGRFVLRTARARPDTLVIGVDPVAEAMAESAARAARKPARGGAENAVLIAASLEALPVVLRGRAHEVTVNYPWGSLLLAVGWPRVEALQTVAELLAPGGTLLALLNASASEQEAHASRLELPPLEDPAHVADVLVPGWERAGLTGVAWSELDPGADPPNRTSWGRRLTRGSGRRTLRVDATAPQVDSV